MFSSYTNTAQSGGIGYGDLFLSSAWTPYNGIGDAPYAEDDNSNGTAWTYGFSLDNRWGVENEEHKGILYSLNTVNDNNGDVAAVGKGTWDTTVNKVNFEIDLSDTNLIYSDTIALHWDMTCGNDTIEGEYSVPEPAILGLLALGLIGIGASKRKDA